MDKLRFGSYVFVKRSYGSFTYALYDGLVKRDPSLMSFRVNDRGDFKRLRANKVATTVMVPVIPAALMKNAAQEAKYVVRDEDEDDDDADDNLNGSEADPSAEKKWEATIVVKALHDTNSAPYFEMTAVDVVDGSLIGVAVGVAKGYRYDRCLPSLLGRGICFAAVEVVVGIVVVLVPNNVLGHLRSVFQWTC